MTDLIYDAPINICESSLICNASLLVGIGLSKKRKWIVSKINNKCHSVFFNFIPYYFPPLLITISSHLILTSEFYPKITQQTLGTVKLYICLLPLLSNLEIHIKQWLIMGIGLEFESCVLRFMDHSRSSVQHESE